MKRCYACSATDKALDRFGYCVDEEECGRRQDDARAFRMGAAVAFGIMGMAEAIRENYPCATGRHEWVWSPGFDDDVCARCGATGSATPSGTDSEGT